MPKHSTWLWLECVGVFIVTPALFSLGLINTPLILLPLALICIPAFIWLGINRGFTTAVFWKGETHEERKHLGLLLKRFLAVSLVLLIFTAFTRPEQLFDLPREMPMLWLLFVLGYPLLSVYPQEILFRAFFFVRYKPLFNNNQIMIWVNAFLFAWAHVAFANITAVLFSFVGGWFFATTYIKTHSLRLVCLEHALYGILVFTIGYGRLFTFEGHFLN